MREAFFATRRLAIGIFGSVIVALPITKLRILTHEADGQSSGRCDEEIEEIEIREYCFFCFG